MTIDAVMTATTARPPRAPAHPARFALVLRPMQDYIAVSEAVEAALATVAARVVPLSAIEQRILVAELPDRAFTGDDAAAFAAAYALQEQFELEAAEPDVPTAFFPEETEALRTDLPAPEGIDGVPLGCWAPAQPELDPLWALRAMRVPHAWEFSRSRRHPSHGEGIVVAQPDTGVTRHLELADVLTVPGFDVLSGDTDPTDSLDYEGNPGHGTGTASVLVSPATHLVTGAAPQARHMPIRAIESVIRVTQVSVAQAIDWATEHGAHVITMSLGGIPSFALQQTLRRAVAADVIVLAAAGNCVKTVVWPARYDNCIAVTGTNSQDAPWRGSCRGATVDIAAPAENVLRASVQNGTNRRNEVGQGQGTSFAVALTAGVAALWLAHHGRDNVIASARTRGETVQAMFSRLLRATARRPVGWDSSDMGAGIVDARALLEADFDRGRDQETVKLPADPREQAATTVRSLVAESLGHEAASDAELDWHRFGPEIATAVLRRPTAASRPEREPAIAVTQPVSPELATAVTEPALRTGLGLDAPLALTTLNGHMR